jgi:HEAT repeat protein
MYPTQLPRPSPALAAGLLLLLGVAAAPAADQARPDGVEGVRRALQRLQQSARDREAFRADAEQLKKDLAKFSSVRDLARILRLSEWPLKGFSPEMAKVVNDLHREVAKRFLEKFAEVAEKGTPSRQAALAVLAAELAAASRNAEQAFVVGDPRGGPERQRSPLAPVIASLVPPLLKMAKTDDPGVRASVARALGQTEPDPGQAVPVLAQLLGAKKEQGVRRAAAGALRDLIAVVAKRQPPLFFVGESDDDLKAFQAVLPEAGRCLVDADPVVRRLCLEAIREAGDHLADHVTPPGPADEPLPPEAAKQLAALRKALVSRGELLNKQVPAVLKATHKDGAGADDLVAAERALEVLARARRLLLLDAAAFPKDARKEAGKSLDDPLAELAGAAKVLKGQLAEKHDVRVRLGAIYVLEELGADAAAAADELIAALKAKDSFVRWGALRALGKMAPHKAKDAASPVAALLADDTEDVRVTAALVLARYGAAAKAVVPELGKTLGRDDARMRVLAARALASIGREAKESVPALIRALSAKEAEVRLAVVGALQSFGAPDKETVTALTKALTDPDAAVRRAAAEALLGE